MPHTTYYRLNITYYILHTKTYYILHTVISLAEEHPVSESEGPQVRVAKLYYVSALSAEQSMNGTKHEVK